MSEKSAIEAPEKNVITIDLAEIKAIDQLQRINRDGLPLSDNDKVANLISYIQESGIEQEINFTDDRILKIWYAFNLKYQSDLAVPSFGSKIEDWVLLSEYMRNFTPSDENYDALVNVLQFSIVNHWGSSDQFENKVELNDDEWDSYKLAISVIHDTKTWERLPYWYQEYLLEAVPYLKMTPAEAKLKELFEILKEKAA